MPKWNLIIPDDTDRLVRVLLAHTSMKKGDLSSFVNEAVRDKAIARMADQIRAENPDVTEDQLREAFGSAVRREALGELIDCVRERSAGDDPDALQAEIDQAVAWVRAHPA